MLSINLLFPVLNEKKRLANGIEKTISYMERFNRTSDPVEYRCTILDNGSDDETPEIAQALCEKYPGVVFCRRIRERGVGIAFRTGVQENEADIVGYMDIDLSTDIENLGKTIDLFRQDPSLEYVNGTRFAKGSRTIGRKWYRKITSAGLVFLLKAILHMKATDGICGFTFMRKETASELVAEASEDKGWFYMIELLLRAERKGIRILDLPVTFTENYDTTVHVGKTIWNYLVNIKALHRQFRLEEKNNSGRKDEC